MSNQPSTFTQLLSTLPPVVQPIIRQALASAPPDVRKELLSQLEALQKLTSNNPAAYSDLMGIAKRLASPAVQPFSKIAIAGSINVGKSTLFNALTAGVSDKAEVSPVPGTTTKNQSAEMGLFNLIDTPGMNHGADSGKQESQHALDACEESDFIIAVFDATRGITTGDREIYGYLTTLNKPFIVALNKIDLISPKKRPKIIASCAASLGLSPEEINPISAEKNKGIEQLLLTAAANEPRLLGELGRALPTLREKLAWQAIRRSAIASAVVTLSPLPIIDFIPLTVIQIALVITISRIYAQPINKARALEMLGSLGIGIAGRTIFQELVKLGGPPGWAVSATVGTATTIAIGFCAINWFGKGIVPTAESFKAIGSTIQQRLLKMKLFQRRRRPSSQKLKNAIDMPLKHLTEDLSQAPQPPEFDTPSVSDEKG